jgi:hypothetical protein
MASTYRFWFKVGPDGATPAGQDGQAQDVGGPLDRLLAEQAEQPLDRVGREGVTSLEQGDELAEQPGGPLDLHGVTGHGDLVAADVDVGAEGALDETQQLIRGAEQTDHALRPGHDDARRRGAAGAFRHGHAQCYLSTALCVFPSDAERDHGRIRTL